MKPSTLTPSTRFLSLAMAAQIAHEREFSPAPDEATARDEIGEAVCMYGICVDEDDGSPGVRAAKLQNLAEIAAACMRHAALLLQGMSDAEVLALVQDVAGESDVAGEAADS